MIENKEDPTSDAARADPAVAKKDREELKEIAERELRRIDDRRSRDAV